MSDHLEEFKDVMDEAHVDVEAPKMTEPKFTPGPWNVKFHIVDDMTFCVVEDESRKAICEVFSHEPNWEDEQEANARLLAAAPEMYEMLASIRRTLKYMGYLPYLVKDIDLILRKARGEREVEK